MIDQIKDDSLKKHTGKNWKEWIKILNSGGAQNWTHQEIVAHLKFKHKQSLWWQQMIANGYQVAIGIRVAGQSLKGTYSATLTKLIPVDQKVAWNWCLTEEGVQTWLNPLSPVPIIAGQAFEIQGGIFGEIRTVKKPQRVRLTWREEDWEKTTTVQFNIFKKGKNKSMLVIQHEGIKTAKLKAELRTHWRAIVENLAKRLVEKN